MIGISIGALEEFTRAAFVAAGLRDEHAAAATEVYMRATLRGVSHHDIYDLPGRLRNLTMGAVKARPEIRLLHKFNALENYDGDNGLGEVCASFILERAVRLADEYGIGFCAIRHSGHFLAAAPYVEKAAEEGYLALIFSRTIPLMGAPGTAKRVIGNAPLGFAAAVADDCPIMLDVCHAYASYGKLEALAKEERDIPTYWGTDAEGLPTADPSAVLNGGTPSPIGGHKGFGLALLVEILAGVLAEGPVIDQPVPPAYTEAALYSQAAMVLKPAALLGPGIFPGRNKEMLARLLAQDPGIRIPGRNSGQNKARMLREESVDLKASLVAELDEWAVRLGIGNCHSAEHLPRGSAG